MSDDRVKLPDRPFPLPPLEAELRRPGGHAGRRLRRERRSAPGYKLKLNSYDLGVDVELADAINRIASSTPKCAPWC